MEAKDSGVDLFWLPLGAGGHVVRMNGRIYERIESFIQRRPPLDLYHSALEVQVAEERYTIEMTPVPDHDGVSRGVVVEGPVGSRLLASLRVFRYEVRRWPGGTIPDVNEAVASPQRVADDEGRARRLLELVPGVPALVWGRDEIGAGEMWNSNSIISWLLAASGLLTDEIRPPPGGRAPGWGAGLIAAGGRVAGGPGPARGRSAAALRGETEAVNAEGARDERPPGQTPPGTPVGRRAEPRRPPP